MQRLPTAGQSSEEQFKFLIHLSSDKRFEHVEEPLAEAEGYIIYHHVDDENEAQDPHFCIIWTSKKLGRRISEDFVQDDATYRLTWQGYPLLCLGVPLQQENCIPRM